MERPSFLIFYRNQESLRALRASVAIFRRLLKVRWDCM